MNEENKPSLRLAVDNSEAYPNASSHPEVVVAFGQMAAQINECLADETAAKGVFASVLSFVETCREFGLEASEVDTLLGSLPSLSSGLVDEPLSVVLRGSARVVAAITSANNVGTPRYEKARDELAIGMVLIDQVTRVQTRKKGSGGRLADTADRT